MPQLDLKDKIHCRYRGLPDINQLFSAQPKEEEMKTKLYGLMALMIVATMILAACTPKPTAQPTAVPTEAKTEAPVVWANVDPTGQKIVFWHQHTKAREAALLEIIDEFNKTNEYGIEVTAEFQGSYSDIFNKMLPILNTPDVPDLVVAYQNQAATYQLADALVDMNSMVNSPKWGLTAEEQADFFPGFFAQDVFPNFGNARLGFPPNRSMEVLYYNLDWMKELGFENPPATPEEFKAIACAASQTPFSKATAEGSHGYELSIDTSRLASWTFAFGGDIYDYENGVFTLNSQAAIDSMTFLQGLFQEGCAKLVTEDYGDQTDFGNGTLMFAVGSSSGLPYYQSAAESGANHAWGVAAIPHTSADPVMNVYGASVSMPKTTPERELAAWLFLKYYTGTEAQAKWAIASQYFPVRASVAEGLTDYFASQPAYKTAFDMLKYGHFEPPVPGYDFVREEVNLALAAIADGADVKTTLDALNATANDILAEQMAQIKK